MHDLSLLLWSDLKTDEERIALLESKTIDTKIVDPVMADELVKLLKCRIAIKDCINYANNREAEWGIRAETAFQFLYDALSGSVWRF